MKRSRIESGQSLVELLVAMTVLVVLVSIGFVSVSTYARVSAQGLGRAQGTFADNTALNDLRQEILSASVIYNPNTEWNSPSCDTAFTTGSVNCAGSVVPTASVIGGFSLRVFTELNGKYECVQWRLPNSGTYAGDLQTRSWTPGSSSATSWQTLASQLKNTASQPPFVLDSSSSYGGQLLDGDLLATGNNTSGSTVEVKSSFAERDGGYPSQVPSGSACSPPSP